MGKFNEDVIGEKIIYKGHPAIIEDFVSCYEGDYWDIKVEGVYPPDLKVPCYTPPGEIIKKKRSGSMAKFCQNCGTKLNEDQDVCLNCGKI